MMTQKEGSTLGNNSGLRVEVETKGRGGDEGDVYSDEEERVTDIAMTPNLMDEARQLIQAVIPYLVHGSDGFGHYEFWIDSRDEMVPGIRAAIPIAARGALESSNFELQCSALQAIAVTGDESDIPLLEAFISNSDPRISLNAAASVQHIRHRRKSLGELLDEVTDRKSFIVFAEAMAEERARAAIIERDDSHTSSGDGVLGWSNHSIEDFISAGLTYFLPPPGKEPIETPSWKDFAEFLYSGKIIE